jgi:hypothetical protein
MNDLPLETKEVLRPRSLFRGEPAHKWLIFIDDEEVSSKCVGASDDEGWVEVFDVLPDKPDMPATRYVSGRGVLKNYLEMRGGYVLLDPGTMKPTIKRLEGNVRIELRPLEAA